jgi:hypothetical protein
VGSPRIGKRPQTHSGDTATANLPQQGVGLEPTEGFFDAFVPLLAEEVFGMAAGASVSCGPGLSRHVRRDPMVAQLARNAVIS